MRGLVLLLTTCLSGALLQAQRAPHPAPPRAYPSVLSGAAIAIDLDRSVRDRGPVKNLLFYGNSYSMRNGGVASVVQLLAVAGGHAPPRIVERLVSGENLLYHRTNPGQVAAITNSLPAGQKWDAVVMQGESTEATLVLGNRPAFRDNALGILQKVRQHSPGAVAVMFQTWARGAAHDFYPVTYPNPWAMHQDIRTGYLLAVQDINRTLGQGSARNAAVGDALALRAFDPSHYAPDHSHPSPATTLVAAMAIYQAIYRTRTCDLAPQFATTDDLVAKLQTLELSAIAWARLEGIAERVADFALRRYPGSNEDLLLEIDAGGPPSACPLTYATLGDRVTMSLTSPNGQYAQAPALMVMDLFVTGSPPGMLTMYPEWHFQPLTAVPIAAANTLSAGLTWNLPVIGALPGLSLMIQGVVLGPSPTRNNPDFTMTDAHEVLLR